MGLVFAAKEREYASVHKIAQNMFENDKKINDILCKTHIAFPAGS